ncbi:cytochrome d ubiquinol oxidase subunit II [Agaribacterium sp. ZY112]|uniref:cytochrome d ubiquinol oxidase subunit II n=1 Tax=Agaribacterium sp. ZY112 TaxID=3233574 RepID=UPI003525A675
MDAYSLPIIFVGLMGLAILVYAILDGYDLGTGILLPLGEGHEKERDRMIASIGPFWDANETWLVLAVGLLLIAFPEAHSQVLHHFYLPVTVMLIALIMRGVAFDFRAKAAVAHQALWDKCFKFGSLVTALSQGYMLGLYIVGFNYDLKSILFAVLSALGVCAAYCYIGASWLVYKTEGELQIRAKGWALFAGRLSFLGVVLVSLTNPLVNSAVFDRWFDLPQVLYMAPVPLVCLALFYFNERQLFGQQVLQDRYCYRPLLVCAAIFLLCFSGIGYSFFPYIVPGELTIWQAASAPESLRFILYGALVVVPCILAYTIYAYWVFRGKASDLHYY